jgi:hypothetical protein
MKGICYIILIVAFLMFYQREPIFTIIIIGMIVGVYLLFKFRKFSTNGGNRGFLSNIMGNKNRDQDRNLDDLITLMMLQQLFSNSPSDNSVQNSNSHKMNEDDSEEENLKKIKDDILSLFNTEKN